jgi:hypothetical protein
MRFRDRASHAAPTLPAAGRRASAAETAVGDLASGRGKARTPVAAAALLAVVALLTAVFGGVQIAAAADGPQSVTFGCTGFPQELTVPPGVTQMNVSVRGAAGAGDAGGLGGLSTGVMNVTPGATLRVTVGCQDGYGHARGGNGGRQDVLSANGSNGGGSSGVTDDATGSALIVAGGGGGTSGRGLFYTEAGGGHAPDVDGAAGGPAGVGSPGIGGGSSTPAGGDGGTGATASSGGGGGGGGGGYPYGGGGGGGGDVGGTAGGGGGGGNSFAGSSVSFASLRTAAERADGEVTISYTGPPGVPQLFRCTGSAASYTVPAGVTSLSVVAAGAAGGQGPGSIAQPGGGGRGALRTVLLDVTPGVTYHVAVGCQGGKGQATEMFSDGGGGGGGFGVISGGGGGRATADGLAGGPAGGGGGGGASGVATQYPLTANSLLLAAAGAGGGGGAGRYTDGGGGGAGDARGSGNTGCCGGAPGVLGAAGGTEVGAIGGNGQGGSFGTSAGGGGGGGGGLQGGGGGDAGVYLGGGGGGGAGGRSALSSSAHPRPTSGYNVLGGGDGVVMIAPVWSKTPTTTTVTVPTGAVYDGSPKTASAATVDDGGTVIAHPAVTYLPGPGAPINAGSYTASATYLGDDTHEESSDSKMFTIATAPSVTTVTVADATYDGNPHGATAKVTGAGGLDQTLTVTYTGRAGTTYGPSTTAPTNAGAYTASAGYAGDSNHNSSNGKADYTIKPAPLTITAHDKTQQYSDPSPVLTWKYDGFVNSEGPGVLNGTTTCTTTATVDAAGNVASPAGDYPIICSGQTGANYDIKYVAGTFKVTREDAQIEYTGDTLVTLGSTSSTTTVELAGAIREAVDGTLGDKLATTMLAFTLYKSSDATLSSAVASCTAAVTVLGSGAGAGRCSVSVGEENYVVKIQLVPNGYYAAPVEDATITVVTPGTGRTTGGGWLTEPTLKTRSNFGFTVKYLRNGNVQGNSLFIYRRTVLVNTVVNPSGGYLPAGEYNWIVKSNAMSALTQKCSTTTPKICTATFTGKANITAVNRSTGSAFSLGGNHQFQVDVTDNGEPGSTNTVTPDSYALRVWNAGGTYYQLGAPNAQVKIEGGNIQIRP